jgi:hypothetical protein
MEPAPGAAGQDHTFQSTPFIGRIIVHAMGANPPGTFSPDGLWWWDGAQWRSAISPDGRWRWNGQAWEPYRTAHPRGGGGGAATAIVVTILAFGGVIVLVSVLVIVVLLTMGNQIGNVFSNVVAALGASPSP